MSLKILFMDELNGFYKSKVMILLWFGLPLLSFLMRFIESSLEGTPLSLITALLIGNIGGMLGFAMIGTSLASEINHHVYDLFIIRPVKKANIIISKFLAVFTCLFLAAIIAIIFGMLVDVISGDIILDYSMLKNILEPLTISLSMMAISCSTGVLIGITISSIAAAAILSVYIGSQLSSLLLLPTFIINGENSTLLSIIIGTSITLIILLISILIFNKKQF
ncbi:MAG: hypothetical protein ACTSO4_17040 [Promethearchaeota archaeon]